MKTNRAHRIGAASKKRRETIFKKGLRETGIDQYREGGKYDKENKSEHSAKK